MLTVWIVTMQLKETLFLSIIWLNCYRPGEVTQQSARSHGAHSAFHCQSTKFINSSNHSLTWLPNAAPHWAATNLDNGTNILRAANWLLSSVGKWCLINVFECLTWWTHYKKQSMKCAITFIHKKFHYFSPCATGLHYLLSLHYYLQQSRQNIKTLYSDYHTLSLLAVLLSRGYTNSTKAV